VLVTRALPYLAAALTRHDDPRFKCTVFPIAVRSTSTTHWRMIHTLFATATQLTSKIRGVRFAETDGFQTRL